MAKRKGPFKLFPNGKDPRYAQLTPSELAEFTIRQQALNLARIEYTMLEESYIAWTKGIKEKYGLTAQFDIDLSDGTLTPKEAVPNV